MLTPSEYGIIGFIMPIIAFIGIIIGFGLHVPLVNAYHKDKSISKINFSVHLFTYTIWILFLSIVLIVYLYFNYEFISKFIPEGISLNIIIVSIIIATVSTYCSLLTNLFRMQERFYFIASTSLSSFILQYSVTLFLLSKNISGVTSFYTGNLVAVSFLLILYIFKVKNLLKLSFSLSILKKSIKNGQSLVFVELGDRVMELSDRLILARFVDMSSLGVYSLASTGARLIAIVSSSYTNSVLSKLYDSLESGDTKIFGQIQYLYYFIVALGIVSQLLGNVFIYSIFPESYESLDIYFSLLVPVFVMQTFFFYDYVFHYFGKSAIVARITIVIAFINLTLNLILIPMYGVYAAIFSSLLSFCIRMKLQYHFLNKEFSINLPYVRSIMLLSSMYITPLYLYY